MTQLDHAKLVHDARRGDARAFGVLVEAYWERAVAVARAITNDLHLAQDVAQESFLQAHRSLQRLTEADTFGVWLTRITRNIAVDRVRNRQRGREQELLEPEVVSEPEPAVLPELAELQDDIDRLQRAIGRLPPAQRRMILMRYGRGMSMREIATECGKTITGVKVAIFRSRNRLLEILGLAGR